MKAETEREREKRRGKVSIVVVSLVYCEAITALETTISQVSDTQLLAEPFIYLERETHTQAPTTNCTCNVCIQLAVSLTVHMRQESSSVRGCELLKSSSK